MVNSSGWPANGGFTSAQANQLDIDHANAADKSQAGDAIAGTWTLSASSSGIVVPSSSTTEVIASGMAAGVTARTAGALQSTAVGGLALNGGATDAIAFGTSRSKTIFVPAMGASIALGAAGALGAFQSWQVLATTGQPIVNGVGFVSAQVNTANANQTSYQLPFDPSAHLYNGATLTSAVFYFVPTAGHGALPNQPAFGIYRAKRDSTIQEQPLLSGVGYVVATVGTVGAYNSGATQSITYTPNQNNVMDTVNFEYMAIIWDESGSHAIAGCQFIGAVLTFGSITTSAPA
jgi:hypothetical protein